VTIPILEAREVTRRFERRVGLFRAGPPFTAVRLASLSVQRGETLAIVGESGSGKTTLGNMLLGLDQPSAGEVLFEGADIATLSRKERARRIQPVFQDPTLSLNPRRAIGDIIGEPLAVHGIGTAASRRERVASIMASTGLAEDLGTLRPSRLSDGQLQRVAIARALILGAEILVCDEPVAAFDVPVQAEIVDLLMALRRRFRLTIVMIARDMAVVRRLADRVLVLHQGAVVEQAATEWLFTRPAHPYTQRLLRSVLTLDAEAGLPEPEVQPA
jgi:peptide/nickel transport system ATP-binding protein